MTDQEKLMHQIRGFLDKEGRVFQYPAKRNKQLWVLYYLTTKFQPERKYTQDEVGNLLLDWHTFKDWALLRRELYDAGFLYRPADGSYYTVADPLPELELS